MGKKLVFINKMFSLISKVSSLHRRVSNLTWKLYFFQQKLSDKLKRHSLSVAHSLLNLSLLAMPQFYYWSDKAGSMAAVRLSFYPSYSGSLGTITCRLTKGARRGGRWTWLFEDIWHKSLMTSSTFPWERPQRAFVWSWSWPGSGLRMLVAKCLCSPTNLSVSVRRYTSLSGLQASGSLSTLVGMKHEAVVFVVDAVHDNMVPLTSMRSLDLLAVGRPVIPLLEFRSEATLAH